MAEEKQEEVAAKKSGNPMMIVLIVLIVILMAAIGGIGYILYSKGFFDEQVAGEKKVEEVEKKDEEKNPENVFFNTEIKDLVLNVTTSKGREKLMKLSFSIKSTESTIEALVTAAKPEIVDIVIHQVSSRNSEELLTAAGKDLLKEELLSEVNSILNEAIADKPEAEDGHVIEKNMVKDIYFTTFVIK
jgi:flagellar FliL protein